MRKKRNKEIMTRIHFLTGTYQHKRAFKRKNSLLKIKILISVTQVICSVKMLLLYLNRLFSPIYAMYHDIYYFFLQIFLFTPYDLWWAKCEISSLKLGIISSVPKIQTMNFLCWAVGYECVPSDVQCAHSKLLKQNFLLQETSVTLNGTEQYWLPLMCKRHFFNRDFCQMW